MADVKYEISQLFQKAFGLNLPVYVPYKVVDVYKGLRGVNYTGVQAVPAEEAKRLSWLGTPILHPIKLKGKDYPRYMPNGEIELIELEDFYMPPATLVDFRRAKNITKTNVLGDSGTVKEIYGFDDWKIDIRGIALKEPGKTAQEQIEQILQWEEVAESVEVQGDLFQDKEIRKIVIEQIEIRQVAGAPNTIPFRIQAVSDQIIEWENL